MGLDFDILIDVFNQEGLKTRWMTEKETKRLKTISNDTFAVNGKAIEITTPDGVASQIGYGIVTKIFYDSIKPSNLAKQFLNLNTEEFEGEKG